MQKTAGRPITVRPAARLGMNEADDADLPRRPWSMAWVDGQGANTHSISSLDAMPERFPCVAAMTV
jgi:hypothetical protein